MKQTLLFWITAVSIMSYLIAYPFLTAGIQTVAQVSIMLLFLYLSWDFTTDLNKNRPLYFASLLIGGSFVLVPMIVYEQNRSTSEQFIWLTLVAGAIVYSFLKEYKWKSK